MEKKVLIGIIAGVAVVAVILFFVFSRGDADIDSESEGAGSRAVSGEAQTGKELIQEDTIFYGSCIYTPRWDRCFEYYEYEGMEASREKIIQDLKKACDDTNMANFSRTKHCPMNKLDEHGNSYDILGICITDGIVTPHYFTVAHAYWYTSYHYSEEETKAACERSGGQWISGSI